MCCLAKVERAFPYFAHQTCLRSVRLVYVEWHILVYAEPWCIVRRHPDASWWLLMRHHEELSWASSMNCDEPSWCTMMAYHEASWAVVMGHSDELSRFIMMNYHEQSSWFIIMSTHATSMWVARTHRLREAMRHDDASCSPWRSISKLRRDASWRAIIMHHDGSSWRIMRSYHGQPHVSWAHIMTHNEQ